MAIDLGALLPGCVLCSVVRATQKKAVGVKVRKDSVDVEELNKRVIEEMEYDFEQDREW